MTTLNLKPPEANMHQVLQALVMKMYSTEEPIEIDLDEVYQYNAAYVAISAELKA